jgi:PPOX class probable F420-dependent enzyme
MMHKPPMPNDALDAPKLAFLVAARRAILATIDQDGRPRLVPVCFIVESDGDDRLRLLTPLDDKPKAADDKRDLARVRDIRERPAVSVLVDRWDEDWSRLGWLRVHGRATLLEPAEVPHDTVERLRSKYPQYATHALESSPIIAIDIERATSWGRLDPV